MNKKEESLKYYKNLIDLNNNYNENELNSTNKYDDQDEEEEEEEEEGDDTDDSDEELYKTAIFTKEISKNAIIKPNTMNLNDSNCYNINGPKTPSPSSAVMTLINDSYTSSNNSIQSTSSSSAAIKTSPDQPKESLLIDNNNTENNKESFNYLKQVDKTNKKKKTDNLLNTINCKYNLFFFFLYKCKILVAMTLILYYTQT